MKPKSKNKNSVDFVFRRGKGNENETYQIPVLGGVTASLRVEESVAASAFWSGAGLGAWSGRGLALLWDREWARGWVAATAVDSATWWGAEHTFKIH
jgi:hypothetical protein